MEPRFHFLPRIVACSLFLGEAWGLAPHQEERIADRLCWKLPPFTAGLGDRPDGKAKSRGNQRRKGEIPSKSLCDGKLTVEPGAGVPGVRGALHPKTLLAKVLLTKVPTCVLRDHETIAKEVN